MIKGVAQKKAPLIHEKDTITNPSLWLISWPGVLKPRNIARPMIQGTIDLRRGGP